jgi:hypothetical protein
MAMTLSSTTLTYNDGSTNTTNIQNTIAGLGAGTIGSYAQLSFPANDANRTPGYEVAGSSLRYTTGGAVLGNPPNGSTPTTPGGSWRLMGELPAVYIPQSSSPKGTIPAFTSYSTGGSVWLRYA